VKVKGFAWVGVAAEDFERSLRFFTEVLGLPIEVQSEEVAILTVGPGQQLEIFGGDHPAKLLTANPVIAFEVDDMAAARGELIAAGVELIGDVGRWNGFEWQYFRSPDGHIFEIKTVPRAAEGLSS
jgi:catechol 2,3-dioxygenase-like lactoylglutathione lyase family enzyme